MAKTTKEQVWRYIKSLGRTFTQPEVRDHFGLKREASREHFYKLREKGAIRICTKVRHGPNVRWEVANPNVKIEDERGLHPNSLANLQYVMSQPVTRARTERERVPGTWAKATMLDKCWGLRSDSLDILGRKLSNRRREGAPGENASREPA